VPGLNPILADRRFRKFVRGVVAVPLLPVLAVASIAARLDTDRRRRRGARPRLIWGPVPIISIKFWSQALRALGYQTHTCVFEHYPIHERADFDVYFDEFMPSGIAFEPLRAYAVFLWVLRTADVYLSFFDGGFLRGTALWRLELPLLRLAGKRVIVSPYGSDIAVRGHIGVIEKGVFEDYPELAQRSEQTRTRILEFSHPSNFVIRNYQPGFLPRWDVFWPTEIGIDTGVWSPSDSFSTADGSDGEVVVVHASNHRHSKATDRLIEVIEQLKREGLRVRLDLLERRSNTEVRSAVDQGDIVADQFIAGYALFGIEGMAMAKLVVSALGWMPPDLRENYSARELPIVDSDRDGLLETLRSLIEDPERRRRLGEAGRRYALAHHSYAAVGATWEAIISHVWLGAPLPGEMFPAQPDDGGDSARVRADPDQSHAFSHAP
jgi:glycosyltransferase involved in cell wall biosynthesis